jgi:hypothetical protein
MAKYQSLHDDRRGEVSSQVGATQTRDVGAPYILPRLDSIMIHQTNMPLVVLLLTMTQKYLSHSLVLYAIYA